MTTLLYIMKLSLDAWPYMEKFKLHNNCAVCEKECNDDRF